MIYLTKEKFEEIAQPVIDRENVRLKELYGRQGKDRVRKMMDFGWFSLSELMKEVKFKECETTEDFIKDMLNEMDFQSHYYGDDEEGYELGDVELKYPYFHFDDLDNLDESDYEIYNEVMSGGYCTDWFYDKEQGTGFQKAYNVMIEQEYVMFETVEEYVKYRDTVIDEHVENEELETEEEKESVENNCLARTNEYAIYLKNGKVAYLFMDVEESIEGIGY